MIKIVAVSDIGMVRELDEDSVAYLNTQHIYQGKSEERALLVLADGMGGHSAGEIASRLALNAVFESLENLLKADKMEGGVIKEEIRKAYFAAESKIKKWSEEHGISSMGTTLVVGVILGGAVFFGNVGDSRGYIFGRDEIIQATYDDSLVFSMAENGLIPFREIRTHPKKNIITKAIGAVAIDNVQVIRYNLEKGDIVMLSCDGLWETVEEIEMFQILKSNSLEKSAEELLNLALERGATDNVSFVIAEYK